MRTTQDEDGPVLQPDLDRAQAPRGKGAGFTGRLQIIDGLRGAFLVFMTLGHLDLNGQILLQKLHPRNLSFADGASGFVFLSGLVAGLVYARAMARQGFTPAARRVLRRAATVYLFAVGLMLILVIVAQLEPAARAAWGAWLGPLTHPDLPALTAAALLIQHVEFADILAQYVVYLLLAPLVIWACLRGWTAAVLAASAALWLGVQLGLSTPFVEGLERATEALRPDLHLPRTFNLLAWQFLFVIGLAIGVETFRSGPASWRRRAGLDSPVLLSLTLTLLAAVAAFRAAESLTAAAAPYTHALEPLVYKNRLGLLDLTSVAATTWLLAWLTSVAPESRLAAVRRLGRASRAALTWPFLQLLGRHSLTVYAWHVLLIYTLEATSRTVLQVGEPYRSAEAVLVIAALALPAWRAEARSAARRPVPSAA